jgi:hypothetical protein
MLQPKSKSSNNVGKGEDDSSNVPSSIRVGGAAIALLVISVLGGLPLFHRMVISTPLAQSISRLNSTKNYNDAENSQFGSAYLPRFNSPEVAWLMTYPNSVGPRVCSYSVSGS